MEAVAVMITDVLVFLWAFSWLDWLFSYSLCFDVNNRARCIIYAIGLCAICLINKSKLCSFRNQDVERFFSGYLNDILGTVVFLLYLCIVRSVLKIQYRFKLVHVVIITLVCGIIWEYLTPFYRNDTVSDPWDILAYMFGGILFWYIFKGKTLMNN